MCVAGIAVCWLLYKIMSFRRKSLPENLQLILKVRAVETCMVGIQNVLSELKYTEEKYH